MLDVRTVLANSVLDKINGNNINNEEAIRDIFRMICFLSSIQLLFHKSDITEEAFFEFASIIESLSELGLLISE